MNTPSNASLQDPRAEDALRRQVLAFVGGDGDEVEVNNAMSLARRVLHSQSSSSSGGRSFFSTTPSSSAAAMSADQLHSQWRRIERKKDPATRAEVEQLYAQLLEQRQTTTGDDDDNNPNLLLSVLTKLMGQNMSLPPPSSSTRAAATPQNNTNTSVSYHQQRPSVPRSRLTMPPKQQRPPQSTTSQSASGAPPLHPPLPAKNIYVNNNNNIPSTSTRGTGFSFQPGTPLSTRSNASAASSASSFRQQQQQQASVNHHHPSYTPAATPQRQENHHNNNNNHSDHPVLLDEEIAEVQKEEALLLRECLYSLQGIDGERIRYYFRPDGENNSKEASSTAYEGIRIQSPAITHTLIYSGQSIPSRLGSGAMDALRMCGEAGWLYQRIQAYIHHVQQDQSRGVVARAFAGTLTKELREYHSLLTKFESKLDRMTLRQLLVELRMPTNRLKILAMLADGCKHLTGGHLLSALHQHSMHGDTRHANLVQTILHQASRPWFEILLAWTTQGYLSDPHGEFFVVEEEKVSNRSNTSHYPDSNNKYLWRDQYRISKDRIPLGILDKELVAPAFNVGKGINFIRKCLHDGTWTMNLGADDERAGGDDDMDSYDDSLFHNNNRTTENQSPTDLGYHYKPFSDGSGHNPALQRTLTKAASLVHSHILKALKEDHNMIQHLFAMKQFLFLGQGDFFSALMDGLHAEFGGQTGAAGIYKHSLLSIVEGALRSTNAKYMPSFVIDRLQVELLLDAEDDSIYMLGPDKKKSTGDADQRTVFDIFMLDYTVPDPLVAIVHPKAVEKYKTVFSLLFTLKRVEFMLNFTWRQNAIIQHALHTSAQYNAVNMATSPAYRQASYLLRNISITRQSMTHFIVNLKSYLMFEVLEGGWKRLEHEVQEAMTLDEVIVAHDRYLDGIVRKSLLRTDNTEDTMQQQIADQVQTLLSVAVQFCDIQETLFQEALHAADIAAEKRLVAEERLKEGKWGFDSEQDIAEEETFFGLADPEIQSDIMRITKLFNQTARELLRLLGDKVNGNPDDFGPNEAATVESTRYELAPSHRFADIIDDDLDPQRFLIAQLDHNNYYASQEDTS